MLFMDHCAYRIILLLTTVVTVRKMFVRSIVNNPWTLVRFRYSHYWPCT